MGYVGVAIVLKNRSTCMHSNAVHAITCKVGVSKTIAELHQIANDSYHLMTFNFLLYAHKYMTFYYEAMHLH